MPDIATVIDEFFDGFNESDPDRRRAAVAAAWTPDARYLDPWCAAAGQEEIGQLAKQLQADFPGYRFRCASATGCCWPPGSRRRTRRPQWTRRP